MQNRQGWACGNALALLVTGTASRTAESFEGPRIRYCTSSGTSDRGQAHLTRAPGRKGAPPHLSDPEHPLRDVLPELLDRDRSVVGDGDAAARHGVDEQVQQKPPSLELGAATV
jgi:hypothetical protein